MRALCVIEICDAGLVLADAEGVRAESPGFALLHRREILVGEAARAQARRHPRQVQHRFWQELDQQPLARPHRDARSHADLAYHHLRALWQEAEGCEEALLAVPADYSREQLALLLGIARACGIPVSGLMPAPLAAGAAAGGGELLLLDIQLHRVLAHRIGEDDGQLTLTASQAVIDQGLLAIEDVWATMLERQFVEQARFNPLHDADSEQRLYDCMAQWWRAPLRDGRQQLAYPAGARDYRISIDPRAWREAAVDCYGALCDAAARAGADTRILLTHRLAALPGLTQALREAASAEVLALEAGAAAQAMMRHADSIRSDAEAPLLVTSLPRSPVAMSPSPEPARPPTHLLWGDTAWRLGSRALLLDGEAPRAGAGDGCRIRRQGDRVELEVPEGSPVRRNGEIVRGTVVLGTGDRLAVGGQAEPYRLIAEAHDGTTAA
jgi:hypothetical protein